tara:strand:- start:10650 stop:10823 length:174 start_codon:yes stop_codon:yes gene_type:complete
MRTTLSGVIGIICMILAVGAIDGPTGYENDNWLLCFTFAFVGLAFMVLTVILSTEEK